MMNTEKAATPENQAPSAPPFKRKRALLWGQDSDSLIKAFFGSSAVMAIVMLTLITVFLFKEGSGFVGSYYQSLKDYRQSGLEYVDLLKERRNDYTALTRYVNDLRTDWIERLKDSGISKAEIDSKLESDEAKQLFFGYMRVASELRLLIKQKMNTAIEIRDRHITNNNLEETLEQTYARVTELETPGYKFSPEDTSTYILLLRQHARVIGIEPMEAEKLMLRADNLQTSGVVTQRDLAQFKSLLMEECRNIEQAIDPVDFGKTIPELTGNQDEYAMILGKMEQEMRSILSAAQKIPFEDAAISKRMTKFIELNETYFEQTQSHLETLREWTPDAPIAPTRAITSFLTGREWITASRQQDWFGLLPLLSGSLVVATIAMAIAIPLGVGAAIYVNQIAAPIEQNIIKPYIEFISAIPSVVIGFFGVVVFGELLQQLSQLEALQWIPFFPLQQRLNAFTAGCLLALMAVPTIFTLAEEAINNVPRNYKEASLAMGATHLQTTLRVTVPTALSGIISAVMLGFGRVIGETMVVLLCAGNRIKIPDFTEGAGIFFEPVHTMTGIIAQEMGEVVRGSLHYRALFMVGIILFLAALCINFTAQRVIKKYSKI